MALNLEAPRSAADSDVFSNSSRVNVVSLEEYIRGGLEEILLGARAKAGTSCGTKVGLLLPVLNLANIHRPLPENITVLRYNILLRTLIVVLLSE